MIVRGLVGGYRWGGLLCRLRVGVGRFANRPYGVRGQREGRGRGWKVPDGCAGSRRRLYRCVLSAKADVPHQRRLCDSPKLLRGCGGDARESRCGAVSTTRSARPYGDMGAWTRCRRVWDSLSEGYDGGVSGRDGSGEQHDTVLDGVARGARVVRRVSAARTWQGPLERACRFLSRDLP